MGTEGGEAVGLATGLGDNDDTAAGGVGDVARRRNEVWPQACVSTSSVAKVPGTAPGHGPGSGTAQEWGQAPRTASG